MTNTVKTKEVVGKFFQCVGTADFSKLDEIVDQGYIQHDPDGHTGFQGLERSLKHLGDVPDFVFDLKGLFADDDIAFVISHQTYEKGSRGSMSVDIFRVENDMIVEHWVTKQDIVESKLHNNDMVFDYK